MFLGSAYVNKVYFARHFRRGGVNMEGIPTKRNKRGAKQCTARESNPGRKNGNLA